MSLRISDIVANTFTKIGGTSSQFLKADGSVDSTTYQTALTNPVTGTGTTNRIAYWNSVNSIAALDTASYPTLTELSYVKGVTSAIQTQINAITANYVTTNTTQEITVVKTFKSDDAAGLHFKNAAGTFVGALSTYKQWFSGGTSTDLALGAKANLYLFSNDGSNWAVKIDTNRDAIFASKVKIDGGTSSQFLKANGDLDSNTYLTAESDTLATVTGRGASTSSDVSFGATTGANRGIQIQYGNTLNDYGRIRFYQNGVNHSTIHSFSSTWGNGFVSQSRGAINIQGQNGVTFGPWDNPDVTFANTGDISLIKTTNIGHNGATPSSATGWNGSSVARLQSGSTGGNVYLEFRTRADVGDYAGLIFTDNNNGGYIAWRNYVGAGANDGTNGDYMLYGTYTDHIFQAGSSNNINGKPEVFRMYANGNARVMQHFYIPSGTLYMKDSGPSIYENRINAGWNSTGDAIDMWINYEGYQNSNGYFRDFRVGNGKRGSAIMFIDGSEGTTAFSGQVTLNGPLVVDYSNAYLWVKSVNSGSGMQWHDQIWLGRYDRIQTAAQYPNYLPGVAYGIHITQTSDAAFFGLIDRGSAYNSYNCVIAWGDDAPEDVFQYRFNNNVIGTITPSGALTMSSDITAFSDIRIKENITTIDNALEKVLKLRGVYYNRTDLKFDKSKKVGFIAQEVQDVIPEIVTYDEQIDRYAVTYGNTVAILVEAIKEQQKQIEELKSQIKNK